MHKFLFYNKFITFLYMFRALLCSSWRIKTNDELRHRMKQEDIIKFIKITETEMGSPCNENREYKNYQKNNRMDAI